MGYPSEQLSSELESILVIDLGLWARLVSVSSWQLNCCSEHMGAVLCAGHGGGQQRPVVCCAKNEEGCRLAGEEDWAARWCLAFHLRKTLILCNVLHYPFL